MEVVMVKNIIFSVENRWLWYDVMINKNVILIFFFIDFMPY